jgi:site-specific DNA recombinase
MNMLTPKRCAVYCRVSSDERLDQSFNSIDAQRESGLSYVISQRNEGWVPVQDTYEDPGYSGGNMERPGLKRLMADIKAGKVDMVVVYKIDRLSRSLTDFAKMVEVFDKHQVSFSSVTQQINSATSTGRLMLNMLLSFAQFEREVTGERIRDKIAASKRKGLWMGGVVPLGYRVEERQLLIDPQESETVNWIFDTYVLTGSTTLMVQQMKEQNRLTKSGRNFCKQSLHKVLKNRVYLGMISHKGQFYAGAHQPLIDQAKWDCVQEMMARTSEAKSQATWAMKARTEFLLRGLIYSPGGDLYLPMATQKKSGKVYRYYVHNKKMHEGASQSSIPNQPAEPLEQEVTKQVLDFLRSGTMLNQYWHRIQSINPGIPEPQAVVLILQRTAKIWDNYFDEVKSHIIRSLVERITLHEDDTVEVSWRTDNWIPLLETMKPKTTGAEMLELEMPA